MKCKDIPKVVPRSFVTFSFEETVAMDALLRRVLGVKKYCVASEKNSRRREFVFWATDKEFKAIKKAWDRWTDKVIDIEYEELCSRK